MTADDIEWLRRRVHVRRQVRIVDGKPTYSMPKGGKQRTVPLPDSVSEQLAAHIKQFGTTEVKLLCDVPGSSATEVHELLFTTLVGGSLNRNNFNRIWRGARIAAGLPDTRTYGTHVLRHTYASALLAQGVDVRTLSEYLGHSNASITLKTYSHLMPDAEERGLRAVDAFFSGSSAPVVPRAREQ